MAPAAADPVPEVNTGPWLGPMIASTGGKDRIDAEFARLPRARRGFHRQTPVPDRVVMVLPDATNKNPAKTASIGR